MCERGFVFFGIFLSGLDKRPVLLFTVAHCVPLEARVEGVTHGGSEREQQAAEGGGQEGTAHSQGAPEQTPSRLRPQGRPLTARVPVTILLPRSRGGSVVTGRATHQNLTLIALRGTKDYTERKKK